MPHKLVTELQTSLRNLGNVEIAEHSKRFFKTGKGDYGEGDKFLGLRVPVIRSHVKQYRRLSLKNIESILRSEYHEERLFAVLALADKFTTGDEIEKTSVYNLYLRNTRYVNNWDLVDSSAHLIVGPFLENRDRAPIYQLSTSDNLWERRISILSTFYYIKNNDFSDAINIAAVLRDDNEDLIHKAVGWMLREIGNRDLAVEKEFLKKHYNKMPRTMLRYAIEKFDPAERKRYLRGEV